MKLSEFSAAVLRVSEKAAQIARLIRSEEALFSLLVEEKTGASKNQRFLQDFKTLADVLIQETVRHDLGEQFPGIAGNIFGEESNKFTNTLGETVEIAVQPTPAATKTLLEKVLDGNARAAELLANQVHAEVSIEIEECLQQVSDTLDVADIGVWIDPIDSTAQYIKGHTNIQPDNGVYMRGLQCVTVLIGAYNINTGLPLMGVLNQPFCTLDGTTNSWAGALFWGVHHKDTHITSSRIPASTKQGPALSETNGKTGSRIVTSHSEKEDIQSKLRTEYDVVYASGAGYKILCVIDAHCLAYVLSHDSTFKWDTCGPQAVLHALGGGILDLQKALGLARSHPGMVSQDMGDLLDKAQVRYHQADESQAGITDGSQWKNAGGLLAYRDPEAAKNILRLLVQ